MDENEFIKKLKEAKFDTQEVLLMQHTVALKTLCALLAQKGILPEWDNAIAASRRAVIEQLQLIKENGVPWTNIQDDLT